MSMSHPNEPLQVVSAASHREMRLSCPFHQDWTAGRVGGASPKRTAASSGLDEASQATNMGSIYGRAHVPVCAPKLSLLQMAPGLNICMLLRTHDRKAGIGEEVHLQSMLSSCALKPSHLCRGDIRMQAHECTLCEAF